jgi:hypothetical protein
MDTPGNLLDFGELRAICAVIAILRAAPTLAAEAGQLTIFSRNSERRPAFFLGTGGKEKGDALPARPDRAVQRDHHHLGGCPGNPLFERPVASGDAPAVLKVAFRDTAPDCA